MVHDDPEALSLWVHSEGTYSDGGWHHAVVTYDGSGTAAGVHVYVDGLRDESIESDSIEAAMPIANDAPFNLGRIGTGNGMGAEVYYTGALDDVALWGDVVLTEREVQTLYINQ